MPDNSSDFRDRLLASQPITPALREEFHKELDSILNHRLTPRTRLATWGGLAGSLAFTGLCVRSLLSPKANAGSMIVAGAVAAASLMMALWLVRVLRQGGFARRTSFAVVEWIGSIVVAGVVLVTMLGGMATPSDPASTFAAIWGLMLLIVGFAWGTGNRISAATLETREHFLRLESRIADLGERLSK
jgi:hypothetical protein